MRKIWKFIKENKFDIFIIFISIIIGFIIAIFRSNRRFEGIRDRYGKSKREEGYKDGYNKGYREGHYDGSLDSDNYQEGYNKGYSTGYDNGSEDTKSRIYDECKSDWFNRGFKYAVKIMSGGRKRR